MRIHGHGTGIGSTTLVVTVFALLTASCSSGGTSSATSTTTVTTSGTPTQVDVTRDLSHRYGEAEVAVNPKNPNNLVYFVMSEHSTYTCERSGDPICQPQLGAAPAGYLTVPGFIDARVFVSFDRGRTWANAPLPGHPSGHPDLLSKSDPMVTATPDGTFYAAWDDLHMTTTNLLTTGGVLDGGIAVSKSTDGGRTWSTPVLTGTPEDRAWLVSDRSNGMVYVASGIPSLFGIKDGILGPRSTGDPNGSMGQINDRWLVASKDGVHWSSPQRLGGGGTPGYSAGNNSMLSAAHGVVATTFSDTDPATCGYLLATAAPCTGFQTTRDNGVTWTRHQIPVAPTSKGFVLVAADPARAGTYSVSVANSSTTALLVYRTSDFGSTWSGPTTVTDSATTGKFKPWMAYSASGTLGLMWRSYTVPGATGDDQSAPYAVWAAVSTDDGATFSQPLEVTSTPSPAPDPKQKVGGDDFSFINLDADHAFLAWADWGPGEMSGYFSDVALNSFKP